MWDFYVGICLLLLMVGTECQVSSYRPHRASDSIRRSSGPEDDWSRGQRMGRSSPPKSNALVKYKKFSLKSPAAPDASAQSRHESKIINLVQPTKSLKPKSSPQTIVYHPASKIRVQSIAISIPSKDSPGSPEAAEAPSRSKSDAILEVSHEVPDNHPEESAARRQRPRKNPSVRKGIIYRTSNDEEQTNAEVKEVEETTTERHETSTFRIFKYTTTTERQNVWTGATAGPNIRRPTSRSRTYSPRKPEGSRSSLFPNRTRTHKTQTSRRRLPHTTSKPVETQITYSPAPPDETPDEVPDIPESATEYKIITVRISDGSVGEGGGDKTANQIAEKRTPTESEDVPAYDGSGFKPEVLSLLGQFPTGSRNVPRIRTSQSELQKYIKQIEREKQEYEEALKRLQEAVTIRSASGTGPDIRETPKETQLNRYDPEQVHRPAQHLPRSELATVRKVSSGAIQNSGQEDEKDYLRVTLPPSTYGKRLPESVRNSPSMQDESEGMTHTKRIKAWHPQSSKYPPGMHPHQMNSDPDSSLHLIYTPPIYPYQPPANYNPEGGSSSNRNPPPYPSNEIYSTKLQLDSIEEAPVTYRPPDKKVYPQRPPLDTVHDVPVTYQPPNKEFYPPSHPHQSAPATYQSPENEFYPPTHQPDKFHQVPASHQLTNQDFNFSGHQLDHAQGHISRHPPWEKEHPPYSQDVVQSVPASNQPPNKDNYPPGHRQDNDRETPVKYQPPAKEFYLPSQEKDTPHEVPSTYQAPRKEFYPPSHQQDSIREVPPSYPPPSKEFYPLSHQQDAIREVPPTYQPPAKDFYPSPQNTPHETPAANQGPRNEFYPPSYQQDTPLEVPPTYQPPTKEFYPPPQNTPHETPAANQGSRNEFYPPSYQQDTPSEVPPTYQPPTKEFNPSPQNTPHETQAANQGSRNEFYPPSYQQETPPEVPPAYQSPSKESYSTFYQEERPQFPSSKYSSPTKELYPSSYQEDRPQVSSPVYQPPITAFPPSPHQMDAVPGSQVTYQPLVKDFYPPSHQPDHAQVPPATHHSSVKNFRPSSHQLDTTDEIPLTYQPPNQDYYPPGPPKDNSQARPVTYQSQEKEYHFLSRPRDTAVELPATYQPPVKEFYPPSYQQDPPQVSPVTYPPPVEESQPPPHHHNLIQEVPVTYPPPETNFYPPQHQNEGVREISVTYQSSEQKPYPPSHESDTNYELPLTYQPPNKKYYPPSLYLETNQQVPVTSNSPLIEYGPAPTHLPPKSSSEDLSLVYQPPTNEYQSVFSPEDEGNVRSPGKDADWVRLQKTTPRPEDFPFQDTIYYPNSDGKGKPFSDSELVYNFPPAITGNQESRLETDSRIPDTEKTRSQTYRVSAPSQKGRIHIDPGILDGTDWNPSIKSPSERSRPEQLPFKAENLRLQSYIDNSDRHPDEIRNSSTRTLYERPATEPLSILPKLVYFNPEWVDKHKSVPDKRRPEADAFHNFDERKPVVIPKSAAKAAYRILNPNGPLTHEKPTNGFEKLEQLRTFLENPITLELTPAGQTLGAHGSSPKAAEHQRQPKTTFQNPPLNQVPSRWRHQDTGTKKSNQVPVPSFVNFIDSLA